MHYSQISVNRHYNKIPATIHHQSASKQKTTNNHIIINKTEDSKNNVITVSVTKLKQLLDQYKKQVVSQQDIITNLQSLSSTMKQQLISEELPKQISLLNQIKQNNQRILKNRIKDLEIKLAQKISGKIQTSNHSQCEHLRKKIQLQLIEKNKKIIDLQNIKKSLEYKVEGYQTTSSSQLYENMKKKNQLQLSEKNRKITELQHIKRNLEQRIEGYQNNINSQLLYQNIKKKTQQQLIEKNRKIIDLQNIKKTLEHKIEGYQTTLSTFQIQVRKMQTQIFKMQDYIKYLQQVIRNKQQMKNRLRNQQTQTISFPKSFNLKLIGKEIQQAIIPIIIQKNQTQNNQNQQLQRRLHIVQNSNSALRRQLIQLHTYLQQQDEKYQKNVQCLQKKIKKLTQFNSRSNELMKSSTISTPGHSRYVSQSKRNNNNDYSFINNGLLQRKLNTSRIIRLADFKIQLQLQNQNGPDKFLPGTQPNTIEK